MEINEIKDLAKRLMFKLSDSEAEEIQNEFTVLDQQIDLLNKIDTENVEEMIFPYDVETTYLREDVADHTLDRDAALSNAAKVKEGHIVVPKVVK